MDVGCWMMDVGCWMLDDGCWMMDEGCVTADLLSSQPVDQSCSVGHLAAAGLGVVLQVLLLLHGSVIKRLRFKYKIYLLLNILLNI